MPYWTGTCTRSEPKCRTHGIVFWNNVHILCSDVQNLRHSPYTFLGSLAWCRCWRKLMWWVWGQFCGPSFALVSQFWNAHSQEFVLFCAVGLQIMPFFCVYSSQSDAQLCSNHRARATRQCDRLRASAKFHGVLWLSQSCCMTSHICCSTSKGYSVMSQDCCMTN